MKEIYYFPHDFGARNDPKLQNLFSEHGVAGIGAFWCIIEQLYEQGGALPLKSCKGIAFALHMDCKVIESIVNDFDLFKSDGEMFWSESVNSRIDKRNVIAEKRKQAAVKRWSSEPKPKEEKTDDANAMQSDAIKNKINNKSVLSNNTDGGKPQKRFVPPTVEEVKAYIQEKGYTVDAETYWNFYESKGWFVGKNKMKDWRAAVRTWQHGDNRGLGKRRKTDTKKADDEWT